MQLLAGVWHLIGMKRSTDKGRCPLCYVAEDVVHKLLNCLETENWRMKYLNGKWLGMNREVAYRKVLNCTNRGQIRNLGRYLDRIKYKEFNRT